MTGKVCSVRGKERITTATNVLESVRAVNLEKATLVRHDLKRRHICSSLLRLLALHSMSFVVRREL